MSFEIAFSSRFKKDYKLAKRRGKDIKKLDHLIITLGTHGQAPADLRPHILSGNWAGIWECHIEPDWLLIYELANNKIYLRRTGTHADLFG